MADGRLLNVWEDLLWQRGHHSCGPRKERRTAGVHALTLEADGHDLAGVEGEGLRAIVMEEPFAGELAGCAHLFEDVEFHVDRIPRVVQQRARRHSPDVVRDRIENVRWLRLLLSFVFVVRLLHRVGCVGVREHRRVPLRPSATLRFVTATTRKA